MYLLSLNCRWIDRCFAAHKRPEEQNLFPIIQGGLDFELRQKSLDDLIARNANGYAIGGLAGGESKVNSKCLCSSRNLISHRKIFGKS